MRKVVAIFSKCTSNRISFAIIWFLTLRYIMKYEFQSLYSTTENYKKFKKSKRIRFIVNHYTMKPPLGNSETLEIKFKITVHEYTFGWTTIFKSGNRHTEEEDIEWNWKSTLKFKSFMVNPYEPTNHHCVEKNEVRLSPERGMRYVSKSKHVVH